MVRAAAIPLAAGASFEDALSGGDDYQLLFAVPSRLPLAFALGNYPANLATPDGKDVEIHGYQHFST